MNSHKITPADDITALTARIHDLKAEIAFVEAAGEPLEDRIAREVARLESDRDFFMKFGFDIASIPGDRVALNFKAVRGALMICGGNLLVGAVEKREQERYRRDGRPGLSTFEKSARLGELSRDLRQAQVALERAWRAQESAGLQPERGDLVDPELYLAGDADLAQIANGEIAA